MFHLPLQPSMGNNIVAGNICVSASPKDISGIEWYLYCGVIGHLL
jgi:hypothetical protein